ncbi:GTP cyclohydrolase IIa [Salimicrobium halophilum]|uniref:GTP cyclohydrolase III n=1 Tax=Salimicrobium halophilum TaxID=86666 RepID=A0A1G8S9D8_9BACI|nr:GTP cyclohydrolase IIa [Salimicrobium halophilum]SDJ25781.1 GTP cyclohydrolase III [Salimicrobium halophilum]
MSSSTSTMQSEITIGIIGPEPLVRQMRQVIKSFPSFRPIFRVEETVAPALEETKELREEADVLMFLEKHIYTAAKRFFRFSIPVHHIPLSSTGLYRSLLLLENDHSGKPLSIDTVDKDYTEQVWNDLGVTIPPTFIWEEQIDASIQQIADFHTNTYREEGTVALTGIKAVADFLEKRNVPHRYVTPTNQDMIVSLERALLATDIRRNKESQIVLSLIDLENFREATEKYDSEHDIQLLKLKVEETLIEYAKLLDGHLANLGNEHLLVTTRGTFEKETRGYKFIPILEDIKKQTGIHLSIGVGFGTSAAEAGNHARLALRQSKELGGNACYIVREDRSVIGPVEVSSTDRYEQYELAITDADLLERAKKAGMSAGYMTKLMARVTRHKKIDYTAQELASTLNITVRSTHRILLKWMDAGLVKVIGEEKLTHKGRPKRIYRLTFVDEEMLT